MGERLGNGYIPALDGIRALAIMAILIFHYWPAGSGYLPGGFIGVDIFFVVSGYLITLLLIKEWQKNGSISLRNFWLRRTRRLLPALLTLILSMIILAAILPVLRDYLETKNLSNISKYLPDFSGELAGMKMEVISGIFYFANWHSIFRGTSYFEMTDRPSLFEHLWSLGIEEQFYLFWPIIITCLLCKFRAKKISIIIISFMTVCISVLLMFWLGKPSPNDARAYFGTDTRSYALMLGALLAAVWKPEKNCIKTSILKTFLLEIVGLLGFGIIVFLSLSLNGGEVSIFRGGLFLASIAALFIIFCGVRGESVVVRRILSTKLLSWIGTRSYGLYLWHWPIFVLTEPSYTYPLGSWMLLLVRFIFLISIVEISYRYIEIPIRNGALNSYLRIMREAGKERNLKLRWQVGILGVVLVGIVAFCSTSIVIARPVDNIKAGKKANAQVENRTKNEISKQTSMSEITTEDSFLLDEELKKDAQTDSPQGNSLFLKESVSENIQEGQSEEEMIKRTISVIAIGDSVMLGAQRALENTLKGVYVNAKVSRQFTEVMQIVVDLKRRDKLPENVIIHTGTNGTIDEKLFAKMLEILRDRKRVVVFNLRVPRKWQDSNNNVIARLTAQYPNVVLVDWHQLSSARRSEIFYKDGIHLKHPQGTRFYANLAKEALIKK